LRLGATTSERRCTTARSGASWRLRLICLTTALTSTRRTGSAFCFSQRRLFFIHNVTPLHLAACYGRFDLLELLLERGAQIDAQDDQGRTALHYAAKNGHGDMCRFLISSGCDHTLADIEGKKGAEAAAQPLQKELIDFIIATLMQRSRGIQLSGSNVGICVFCQKERAEFVFKPCEHVSLCGGCYREHKDILHFCPMCRKTLTTVQQIPPDQQPTS